MPNADAAPHTITDDGSGTAFDSGTIKGKTTGSVTFAKPGSYQLHLRVPPLHEGRDHRHAVAPPVALRGLAQRLELAHAGEPLERALLELLRLGLRDPEALARLPDPDRPVRAVDAVAQRHDLALLVGQPLQRAPQRVVAQRDLDLLGGSGALVADQVAEGRLALSPTGRSRLVTVRVRSAIATTCSTGSSVSAAISSSVGSRPSFVASVRRARWILRSR